MSEKPAKTSKVNGEKPSKASLVRKARRQMQRLKNKANGGFQTPAPNLREHAAQAVTPSTRAARRRAELGRV